MTWKSTAVVSGAGLLATWLASYSPSPATPSSAGAQSAVPAVTAASDIERQAARLEASLRPRPAYEEPARNLFRFRSAARREAPLSAPVATAPAAPPVPAPPAIKLTGIASDVVDGQTVRTAILTAPAGLLFVREGESVEGFTVTTISDDSVELTAPDRPALTLR